MFPTKRPVSAAPAVPDLLRLAACLMHAMQHAVGCIEMGRGEQHIVAHDRHDATLTPCQLRMSLLEPVVDGVPHLADMITSLEVTAGAIDLGGGLFQTRNPSGRDERWFATTLRFAVVEAIAAQCPEDVDCADVSVLVLADAELDVCAIRVSGDRVGRHLNAAACWLYRQCLVEELLASTR